MWVALIKPNSDDRFHDENEAGAITITITKREKEKS